MAVNLSGSSLIRRGRRSLNAEINVTPFVDVMLVLLIVFMVTAPLLTTGVEITLPEESANPLDAPASAPLSVTIDLEGRIFVQESEITKDQLVSVIQQTAGDSFEERIYLRVDEAVAYGTAIGVMTLLQTAGYKNLALVTDPRVRESN